jgi:TRAP-type C4-dicarboxylate transport system permease small subunit
VNTQTFRSRIDKVLEPVLVVLVSIMVLNVLWQVFTRFILKDPSSYTEELARYLLIWVGLLGASYAVGKKMHLAIDVLTMKLEGRRKHVSDLLIQFFVFTFSLGVVFIGGLNLVSLTLELQQISAALRVKLGYVYLAIPLSGVLMMLYSGSYFAESLKSLKEAK